MRFSWNIHNKKKKKAFVLEFSNDFIFMAQLNETLLLTPESLMTKFLKQNSGNKNPKNHYTNVTNAHDFHI